jgi:hypothetical protein
MGRVRTVTERVVLKINRLIRILTLWIPLKRKNV